MTSPAHRARARLFVDTVLAEGTAVPLTLDQAHYLRQVLRLAPGATLGLFNGRDGEWQAILESFGKGTATVRVGARLRPQEPEPDLTLLFAPLKRTATDFLIEKAAELGATRLVPVLTRHADVARVNVGRLQAIAIEAAEQCERLVVPRVAEPVALTTLLGSWPADRRIIACVEAGPALPLAQLLADLKAAPTPLPATVLTGPEGGFSQTELDDLSYLPFILKASLGPRILRAETAALAALACWQAIAGDWSTGARPPFRAG